MHVGTLTSHSSGGLLVTTRLRTSSAIFASLLVSELMHSTCDQQMHQFSYSCHRKCTEPCNIIKSEAGLKEAGAKETAEWQHGHKTVPATFSHAMIHSAHTRTLHGSSERISKHKGHSSSLGQDKFQGPGQPGPVTVAGAMTWICFISALGQTPV